MILQKIIDFLFEKVDNFLIGINKNKQFYRGLKNREKELQEVLMKKYIDEAEALLGRPVKKFEILASRRKR